MGKTDIKTGKQVEVVIDLARFEGVVDADMHAQMIKKFVVFTHHSVKAVGLFLKSFIALDIRAESL